MNLRNYQIQAIENARAFVNAGKRAPLIVAPTGSGKTTIGAEICRAHVALGGTPLWLAHRRELVAQASCRLAEFGNLFQVRVTTVQALLTSNERPPASLIVFDEAHHYVADEWGDLAHHYRDSLRIGLTATPERSDGQGLGQMFDSLVVAASVKELTAAGYLVPCNVIAPAAVLRPKHIAQRPVDAYLEHAVDRRCVVFSPHVKAAVEHACEFRAAGVTVAVITGDMKDSQRDHFLSEYRLGRIRVLINVYVLTEGWDDPETSCAILARGCGTQGVYLQMVGRILRPAPGKKDALLIDLRGMSNVHGHPDEDRSYSLNGRAIRRSNEEELEVRFCKVCGAEMPGDATLCEECGGGLSELEAPKVTMTPLVKFDRKRRETPEERVETLIRWLRVASSKGFKPGWAMNKFRVVYGDWPTPSVRHEAEHRARGAA